MGAALATVESGTYHVGEKSVYMKERLHSTGTRRGLIYAWGRGNTAGAILVPQFGGGAIAATRAGIPAITGDYGSTDHWGNDAAITRVGEAWTYLQGKGATDDQVYLLGESMGFLAACNWAKANPTKVAALAGVVPAIDLADIHDVTRPDLEGSIHTAYTNEAGYEAALPTNSPSEYAADINGDFPIKCWYSTNDSSITALTVTDFCTAAGGTAISLGPVGHTAGSLDPDDISAFFAETP